MDIIEEAIETLEETGGEDLVAAILATEDRLRLLKALKKLLHGRVARNRRSGGCAAPTESTREGPQTPGLLDRLITLLEVRGPSRPSVLARELDVTDSKVCTMFGNHPETFVKTPQGPWTLRKTAKEDS